MNNSTIVIPTNKYIGAKKMAILLTNFPNLTRLELPTIEMKLVDLAAAIRSSSCDKLKMLRIDWLNITTPSPSNPSSSSSSSSPSFSASYLQLIDAIVYRWPQLTTLVMPAGDDRYRKRLGLCSLNLATLKKVVAACERFENLQEWQIRTMSVYVSNRPNSGDIISCNDRSIVDRELCEHLYLLNVEQVREDLLCMWAHESSELGEERELRLTYISWSSISLYDARQIVSSFEEVLRAVPEIDWNYSFESVHQ